MTDPGGVAGLLSATSPGPFAVLHRPESGPGPGVLEVLTGEVVHARELAELPWRPGGPDLLALLPYRLVAERGFACHDDGAPLVALRVGHREPVGVEVLHELVGDRPVRAEAGAFSLDDQAYAGAVRRVVRDEIGAGRGANFVLRRDYLTRIPDFDHRTALAFYARLLAREPGAYWCFLIHTGSATFVGASPERHVSVADGTAVMNPISGTYRYPAEGPALDGLLEFLADAKEDNELSMVLDEELKMMSRVCPGGVRVLGPRLKEMAHLAHTEYLIEGRTDWDFRDLLRETLFAPTVTGSPLQSACEVIRRHEPSGRGYYSGVAALLGHDPTGTPSMDSAIMIRTADIAPDGAVRIGVGSTLVRDSDPASEAAETRAKAAGLLGALSSTIGPAATRPASLTAHAEVRAALASRTGGLAPFWVRPEIDPVRDPDLVGRRLLVVDAEDTFTAMGASLLRSAGLRVDVRRFDEDYRVDRYDLVIVGPGPGDPTDRCCPKMAHLRELLARLRATGQPFLAVCLAHQVLCAELGLAVVRKATPTQGVRSDIDLFGRREEAYFYNTFVALTPETVLPGGVEVARDVSTGEVHALRAPRFASVQFHPASVMTPNGQQILVRLLAGLLRGAGDDGSRSTRQDIGLTRQPTGRAS